MNLLNDPEVYKLYQDLLNNKISDCDEFIDMNPVDRFNKYGPDTTNLTQKKVEPKIFFDGVEINNFMEDMDYGL